MKCPKCNNSMTVLDSREQMNGSIVRRRRECSKCFNRISTTERIGGGTEDRKNIVFQIVGLLQKLK